MKTTILKKGEACTSCRRRKSRCDGAHPVCKQCASSGRELDCEYSDGITPTRTELLQTYLNQLQRRVQELEEQNAANHGENVTHDITSLEVPVNSSSWISETPPPHIRDMLFDVFAQHQHQICFGLDISHTTRLISTGLISESQIHPALLNAICLWGSRFSQSSVLTSQCEQVLYARAIEHLQVQHTNIQSIEFGLQSIQASILLCIYLFACGGRPLETDYRVNATIRLALGYGMNNITPSPSDDPVLQGERVSAFWNIFLIDRLWALVGSKSAIMQVRGHSQITITTPWPIEYYLQEIYVPDQHDTQPLARFENDLENSNGNNDFSLIVKATYLCELARLLSSSSDINYVDIRLLDGKIFNFISSLSPIDIAAPLSLKSTSIFVHAMAYFSLICLHETTARFDSNAYQRCVQSARYIIMLLGNLIPGEELGLTPLILPSIVTSLKVIMREINRILKFSIQVCLENPLQELMGDLNRGMHCLTSLSTVYTVLDSQLKSLNELRAVLVV